MITSLVQQSGLREVEEVELRGRSRWDSPEKYWEYLTDINFRFASASRAEPRKVRDEARKKALGALGSVTGKNRVPSFNWIAWVDSGTKV